MEILDVLTGQLLEISDADILKMHENKLKMANGIRLTWAEKRKLDALCKCPASRLRIVRSERFGYWRWF